MISTHWFKRSTVQTFNVLGLFIFSVVELLNPLNLEQAFAQAPFYQGKTIRIDRRLPARRQSRLMGANLYPLSRQTYSRQSRFRRAKYARRRFDDRR